MLNKVLSFVVRQIKTLQFVLLKMLVNFAEQTAVDTVMAILNLTETVIIEIDDFFKFTFN